MFQKSLSLVLISLLLQATYSRPALAGPQTDKEPERIAKVKERIGVIGLVEKKRAVVTRRDGTKLRGWLREIKEDSFMIIDDKTGVSTILAYSDVTQVKSKSDGLSTGTKVAIGIGIAAAVFISFGVAYSRSCPTSIPCR